MSDLSDFLGYLSDAMDKPGRATRSLLSGGDDSLSFVPFSDTLGLTNPKNAVSGEDLAHKWFGLDPDSTAGGIAGFGLSAALDPTNLLGLGLGSRAARGAALAARGVDEANQGARLSNTIREGLLAKGAMPAEIAAQTVAKDAAGNPLRTLHGTKNAFGDVDLSLAGTHDGTTLGPGYYSTPSPSISNEYAALSTTTGDNYGKALQQYPDRHGLESRVASLKQEAVDLRAQGAPPALWKAKLDELAPMDQALKTIQFSEMKLADPRNTRMQYLDIRNPLDLRGTGYDENKLHPLIQSLNGEGGNPESYLSGLQQHGYDSIIAPHMGTPGDQYVVFNPKQIYKPWVAPAEQAMQQYGPSAGRSILPYLGGVLGNTAATSQATTRRPQTIRDLLLNPLSQDVQPEMAGAGGAIGGF